jgi:hypothetical protein
MAYNTLSLAEKISTKVVQVGDCLIWQGQKDKRGYGFLRLEGRLQRAHRIAYELRHGPIAGSMVVLHSCDRPSCVNPDHLSIGTQLENVRDMLNKGRANKATGARNAKTKLTDERVAEARAKHIPGKYGHGSHSLAKEYGISKPAMRAILSGKSHRS